MKKILLSLICSAFAQLIYAQVQSGSAIESGRKVLGTPSYTIDAKSEGTVVVEVAIDNKGNVTSAKVISEGTSIKSTPTIMMAQNAAKKLKFTSGTHYPEFQHARVKYTYRKTNATDPANKPTN